MAEEIVKALQAAKKFLWDGKRDSVSEGLTTYICCAIDLACVMGRITAKEANKACEFISTTLSGEDNTLRWWLSKNMDRSIFKGRYRRSIQVHTEEMQAYRLAWIDALINELQTGEKTEGFP